MSTLTGKVSLISIWAYKVTQALYRFKEEVQRQSKINATIKELSSLTDKELRDIGIGRGEIWDIAHSTHPRIAADRNANLKGWV